jgi:hypothetical protein
VTAAETIAAIEAAAGGPIDEGSVGVARG